MSSVYSPDPARHPEWLLVGEWLVDGDSAGVWSHVDDPDHVVITVFGEPPWDGFDPEMRFPLVAVTGTEFFRPSEDAPAVDPAEAGFKVAGDEA